MRNVNEKRENMKLNSVNLRAQKKKKKKKKTEKKARRCR